METHETLTDQVDAILAGWVDDTHQYRVHDGMGHIEITERVTPLCCPAHADPGPSWDEVALGPGGWQIPAYYAAECTGCGGVSRNWTAVRRTMGSDEDVDGVVAQMLATLDADAKDMATAKIDEIRTHLGQQLDGYLWEPEDLDDLPTVDTMASPGIGADGGDVVAWEFGPDEQIIEVRRTIVAA